MDLRLRQRDETRFAEGTSTLRYAGSQSTNPWSGNARVVGSKKVMLDQYSKKYRPGTELRINYCDIRSFECTVTNDTIRFINTYGSDMFAEITGEIAGHNFSPTSSLTNGVTCSDSLNDLATMKAFAKVQEPDVGLLENLAEAAQTLKMIVSPIRGLIDLTAKMRKKALRVSSLPGRPIGKSAKLLASNSANAWLSYRYGIMPLVLSVQGLQQSYLRHFRKKLPWERKSGTIRSVSTTIQDTYSSFPLATFQWRETVTSETVARRVYFYTSADGFSKDLWSLGAHPYQYISLAWELVPASFMLDWSLGLGDWLKTITPAPHIELLNAFISYRETVTTQRSCMGNTCYFNSCTADRATSSQAIAIWSRYNRVPGLPVLPSKPLLKVTPLNIVREVDTLSILSQQLLKNVR